MSESCDQSLQEDHGCSCSSLCSQLTDWDGLPGDCQLSRNASLHAFVEWLPEQLDKPTWSALFKQAVKKSLDFDCSYCFLTLCMKHCEYYSYDFAACRKGLDFAYAYATVERPHFISIICKKRIEKKNAGASREFRLKEFELLVHIVLEEKCWTLLSPLLQKKKCILMLRWPLQDCINWLLLDETSRPSIAPVLDLFIKNATEFEVEFMLKQLQIRLNRNGPWSKHAVSRAKKWCADNAHANLAFVLALLTKDWDLVENLLSSVDVHCSTLLIAVDLAAKPSEEAGSFSTAAKILSSCPITMEMLDSHYFCKVYSNEDLSRACEEQGRWDLALATRHSDMTYHLKCHRFCENRSVLDWLLINALPFGDFERKEIDLVLALLPGCTDTETLKAVLHINVSRGNIEIIEALLSCVDISEHILDKHSNTLLFSAVSGCSLDRQKREIVCSLLAAGLSPFQREAVISHGSNFPRSSFADKSPLKRAFKRNLPNIVDLTLDCGTYSNKTLNEVASDTEIQNLAKYSEELKRCFKRVQESAQMPSSFQQLARLAVSRSVGCQPGRMERIDQLPLPAVLKEAVKFNDILHPNTKTVNICQKTSL